MKKMIIIVLLSCRVLYQGTVDDQWFKYLSCKTEDKRTCNVLITPSGMKTYCET